MEAYLRNDFWPIFFINDVNVVNVLEEGVIDEVLTRMGIIPIKSIFCSLTLSRSSLEPLKISYQDDTISNMV